MIFRRRAALLGLVVFSLARRSAGALPPGEVSTARLEYALAPGARACPAEAALRAGVAARLGHDPFRPDAPSRLAVAVRRRGAGFAAAIQLRDAAGAVIWQDELQDDRCAALIEAVALAIAIELAPDPACPDPPPCPPAAPCPPPPASPPPCAPAAPAPRSPPAPPRALRFELGAGLLTSLGLTPSPGLGGAGFVRFRWSDVSIALEGRALAPAPVRADRGTPLDVASLAALAAPCAHLGYFSGCGLAQLGALDVSGERVRSRDRFLLAAAGGRVALDIPLWRGLAARAHADVLVTFSPTTLLVNEHEVWTTPRLSGAAGAGLSMSF
jgi:hypothetical protein